MVNENGMGPADIAALTRNSGGFGGDGAWWIIILFLFAFAGGWGNGGYGGGGRSGAADNYVLSSDFAMTERKLDGINNGLCDGFYSQAQLTNGVQMSLANGFAGAQLERSNQTASILTQMANNAAAQQQCCCDLRSDIAGVNYSIAQQTNNLQHTMCVNTRDIIDNSNANFRSINDRLTAMEMARKDEKIAEQNQRINSLELAASQCNQNSYLISQLRPAPVPAFSVPNPYAYSGCGCNC